MRRERSAWSLAWVWGVPLLYGLLAYRVSTADFNLVTLLLGAVLSAPFGPLLADDLAGQEYDPMLVFSCSMAGNFAALLIVAAMVFFHAIRAVPALPPRVASQEIS